MSLKCTKGVPPTKVLPRQTLHTRHLVQQLKHQSMQPSVVVLFLSHQFDQLWECTFALHHLESGLMAPTVEEQERRGGVQDRRFILLSHVLVFSTCCSCSIPDGSLPAASRTASGGGHMPGCSCTVGTPAAGSCTSRSHTRISGTPLQHVSPAFLIPFCNISRPIPLY